MNPIAPQPNNVTPQGVASVAPIGAPTPSAIPQAPSPVSTPAPVQTPAFDTSGVMNQIANYYQIPRQTAAITGIGQAQAGVAKSQQDAADYANKVALSNQQDKLDPGKYTISKNSDGSIKILDPTGKQVDIGTYSALTGADPAKTLSSAGVTDKGQVQFVEAYNNLQDYIQNKIAAQNGDQKAQAAVQQYVAANKGLQNIQLGQLQNLFMQQYGSYFGDSQQQGGQTPLAQNRVSDTIASQNNTTGSAALQAVLASLQGQ